eukprot:TRINITY_DN23723_c0_g1_i1.p1 TRINITY_DN23723_c0_g1~~TRINITY_DN23723_c0_g1_i1.p1  ORF type:complete len:652 (+),score=183.55 TRINITY_DN23723_c0_g1_i1:130-1956(+)
MQTDFVLEVGDSETISEARERESETKSTDSLNDSLNEEDTEKSDDGTTNPLQTAILVLLAEKGKAKARQLLTSVRDRRMVPRAHLMQVNGISCCLTTLKKLGKVFQVGNGNWSRDSSLDASTDTTDAELSASPVRRARKDDPLDAADRSASRKQRLHPLHRALSEDDVHATRELLLAEPDLVHAPLYDGEPALHLAANMDSSSTAVLCCLMEHGADVNAADEVGDTALHFAARVGSIEKVLCLLDWGADSSRNNHDGKRPRDVVPPNGDLVKTALQQAELGERIEANETVEVLCYNDKDATWHDRLLPQAWRQGVVSKAAGDEYTVRIDDSDKACPESAVRRPRVATPRAELRIGSVVEVRDPDDSFWAPGVVTQLGERRSVEVRLENDTVHWVPLAKCSLVRQSDADTPFHRPGLPVYGFRAQAAVAQGSNDQGSKVPAKSLQSSSSAGPELARGQMKRWSSALHNLFVKAFKEASKTTDPVTAKPLMLAMRQLDSALSATLTMEQLSNHLHYFRPRLQKALLGSDANAGELIGDLSGEDDGLMAAGYAKTETFKCSSCGKKFATFGWLNRHTNTCNKQDGATLDASDESTDDGEDTAHSGDHDQGA